jgi:hypothetical protein
MGVTGKENCLSPVHAIHHTAYHIGYDLNGFFCTQRTTDEIPLHIHYDQNIHDASSLLFSQNSVVFMDYTIDTRKKQDAEASCFAFYICS